MRIFCAGRSPEAALYLCPLSFEIGEPLAVEYLFERLISELGVSDRGAA